MSYAGLGCPPCSISYGSGGCIPCEPEYANTPECQGCFDEEIEAGFFTKYEILPAVVTGVISAVVIGIVINQLGKRGVSA